MYRLMIREARLGDEDGEREFRKRKRANDFVEGGVDGGEEVPCFEEKLLKQKKMVY